MFVIIGAVVVIASVIGGYTAMGGHLAVLIQPFEAVIIVGAAVGAFVIGNPPFVLKRTVNAVLRILKGAKHNKESYIELLSLLYQIFKLAKTKGMLALESHVENPEESTLFQQFPKFASDHHALVFLCDYLRMLTLGTDNPHQIEALIDEELDTHHQEQLQVSNAIQSMADGMPALGIVAAVLGVIKTMGSITEPPEVLGHLIGGALVGTFLGVFLSYGFLAPLAVACKSADDAEAKYLQCIKAGILAHMQGNPPAVSVEFARKALLENVRPTFYEVEEAVQALPPV
ncbi:MAG: flagellar motor stator protein MotA [Dongiaceae bacterium]